MGSRQPVKGNPEEKVHNVVSSFYGGANLMYSDDLISDVEMRWVENYSLDNRGELRIRKGFSENTALTELLFPTEQAIADFPLITVSASPVKDIVLFKLVEETNNVWKRLADSVSLADFQLLHGAENNVIKLLIVGKLADNSTKYWIKKYTIGVTITRTSLTGTLPMTLSGQNHLRSVITGEQFGKVFFTCNDKGMVCFDNETDTFIYYGAFGEGYTNDAHKPSGIEIRRIGFNMLGTDPLTWVDGSGLTTESIQGVYLTTPERLPTNIVPAGSPFQINIIYTGDNHDFDLIFMEYETEIEATVTKNTTYSAVGIAVYDVEFVTQPSNEVEVHITFTNELVTLTEYIDYFPIGQVDPKAKAIEALNLGGFGMIQVYDRMLYYKGNELWFSDINQFDYVPNFNYILLPTDSTDEVVKIAFFRTSYIIFTKKKIFKISGNFDSNTLTLAIVNDDLGCVSAESVCLVENEMYFVSTRGLRALKTDVFREGLENIRAFDDKVYPIIPTGSETYGLVINEEYMLLHNNRGVATPATIRERLYAIPDVIHYYYKIGSYTFDNYALNHYPRFIFTHGGELYSFMGTPGTTNTVMSMCRFGEGYDDFGMLYNTRFETSGLHMGYPLHEKKYKNVSFKFGGESSGKNIYVRVFGDGVQYHDSVVEPQTDPHDIVLNSSRYSLSKEKFPVKCRNLTIAVETSSALGMSLLSLSYTFKLGKVRDW